MMDVHTVKVYGEIMSGIGAREVIQLKKLHAIEVTADPRDCKKDAFRNKAESDSLGN